MKITFLGNFRESYTSESHYYQTLKSMGHNVSIYQESEATADQMRETALNSDLFFWVHTHGWNTKGIKKLLKELKENNIPSFGYHLDLWLGIDRVKDLNTDPYWSLEYFFTVDPKMATLMNSRANYPKTYFIKAGVFDAECVKGTPRDEYKHDVIFVGSENYHPEWRYRKLLISWLRDQYGDRFKLYGGRNKIRGLDLNDLYASAKIVIGDTLCKNFTYPEYLSDRIFETTGRGGFIIHPYIDGIEDSFVTQSGISGDKTTASYNLTNTEIMTYGYGNFDFLRYLIDYFIENDEMRKSIQERGFERTRKNHTYKNRFKEIFKILKK